MNKSEFINAVAEKEGIEKKVAEKYVNGVIGCISDLLAKGEKIQLVGFGTFEVRDRAEKKARNPKTQEIVTVPACKTPAFKAGKALKEAVSK